MLFSDSLFLLIMLQCNSCEFFLLNHIVISKCCNSECVLRNPVFEVVIQSYFCRELSSYFFKFLSL